MNQRNTPYAVLAVLAVALLVSGCVPATAIPPAATVVSPGETPVPPVATTVSPTNTPGTAKPTPRPLPTTEQECRQQGGSWGPQGMLGRDMCNLPTTDAGQPCTDTSQCEGTCLAGSDATVTAGTCSPYTLNFGCYAIVQDGEWMMLCVD